MAESFSFDVVSEVDLQEVKNAVNQASKELGQRYDLKGSKSHIEFFEKDTRLRLISSDDYKLKAVDDILRSRLVKRDISLKALNYGQPETAPSGGVKQDITLQQGIPQDRGKGIIKMIKAEKFKVQTQIQSDQLRVTAKSKDELQKVIQFLKEKVTDIHLDFQNYR